MQSGIKSMSLGDILENLFKLAGKTAVRNLIVIAILLLPVSALFVYGVDVFFSSFIELQLSDTALEPMTRESILSMIAIYIIYGISIFIFTIGTVLATLAVTIIGTNQFAGSQISWQEGLRQTFSVKFWRMLGASIIESFAVVGVFIIPMIIFIALASTKNGFAIFFGVLILLAAIAAVIYIAIRWSFVFPTIAYEDTGVIESLKRSWNLVGGYWWRTFGIIFLLNILISFALSIITTPISFMIMWDIFAELFRFTDIIKQPDFDSSQILTKFSSFGLRIGIISVFSSILSLLITPLISVVMYFDLRAKKNEFAQDEIPEEPSEPDNSINIF